MATPKSWGMRFTGQVWNFFRRTFKVNPNQMTKKQMTALMKKKASAKTVMTRDDRAMLNRLVKNGKTTNLWKTTLWSDMKENTKGSVVTSRKGNPYLRYKWDSNEINVLKRNISNPKTAYSALGELDSPHSMGAIRRKIYRLRKEGG